jgi:indole-3-glycerol phosphate synthase
MASSNSISILDKIVEKKLEEIAAARIKNPVAKLEEMELFERDCYSFRKFLLDPAKTGIIAEFKRVSPSKGVINSNVTVAEVTSKYVEAGASALSILTDERFFGGHLRDLNNARKVNRVPLLRKDFILDEYQILEAKANGADIILLIAAILKPEEIIKHSALAKSLGLNILLEVHNKEELERSLCDNIDAVGVNNRNLNDFTVSVQNSYDLISLIPDQFLKISESGISNPATIVGLKQAGYQGFLIGENFMKEADPGKAIKEFVKALA